MPKISFKQHFFWGVALVITMGFFVFVRALNTCWQITSPPGVPPANCAGEVVNPLESPVIGKDQNKVGSTSTPELPVPGEI